MRTVRKYVCRTALRSHRELENVGNDHDYDERARAVAYYKRGELYRDRDDYDRAIDDYTEAIRLDPKYYAAGAGSRRRY